MYFNIIFFNGFFLLKMCFQPFSPPCNEKDKIKAGQAVLNNFQLALTVSTKGVAFSLTKPNQPLSYLSWFICVILGGICVIWAVFM